MYVALRSMAMLCALLALLCSFHIVTSLYMSRTTLNRIKIATRKPSETRMLGKIAKAGKDKGSRVRTDTSESEEGMSIPYAGLVGYEANNLFYQPIDINDPLKDTNDLPGEDGSDEKITAIQQRIQSRVDALKQEGQWGNEADQYGKDPLAAQPIWMTMMMQVKACRPFDTWDELALTYSLVLFTTVALAGYIVFVSESVKSALDWYIQTDFTDPNLLNSVVASMQTQVGSLSSSVSSLISSLSSKVS